VAEELLARGRSELELLEAELGREIEIRAQPELHQEQFEVTALEEGPAVEFEVPWLATETKDESPAPAESASPDAEPAQDAQPAPNGRANAPDGSKAAAEAPEGETEIAAPEPPEADTAVEAPENL
jgi:hypothetical protein